MHEGLTPFGEENGAEPTLRARHLTRTFGTGEVKTTALADVSLDLYPGQLALLMGPSGSGKSTLLAVLSGLLHPDGGRVVALGQDLWAMSEREREHFRLQHCGFIFQGYNLFPALTARQQLEMVLRWGRGAGARECRRRADAILGLLRLATKATLPPGQPSRRENHPVPLPRDQPNAPQFCLSPPPT